MLSSAPGSTVDVTFFFFRSNKVLFSTFLRMGKSRSNFRCLPRLENQDCPQRGDLTRGLSAPSPTPHRHSVSCPRTLGTGPEAGHRPQQCPQHTGKVLPPRCSEPPPFLPFQVGSQMDHLNPGTHGGLSCCSGGRGGVSKQRRLPRGPEPRNEPGKQSMASGAAPPFLLHSLGPQRGLCVPCHAKPLQGAAPAPEVSPPCQLGLRTTTSESQVKDGSVSPGCWGLGPQTTSLFSCMCWDDSAETSGQTDPIATFSRHPACK